MSIQAQTETPAIKNDQDIGLNKNKQESTKKNTTPPPFL